MSSDINSDPFALFPYQAIVDRPRIVWPNGARVAVWVIPNIEHFHIEIGTQAPDIRNHSRRDYGNRVGVWRIMEMLAKHGVRGTVALNAEVGRFYPRIMEEATRLKWELMGHGLTNSVLLTGMPKDKEAAVIAEAREVIEQWGQKMRGWLGPGLSETWHTLDLLREHGVEYVCDWVNDDLPYRMNNGLYSIPVFDRTQRHAAVQHAEHRHRRIRSPHLRDVRRALRGRRAQRPRDGDCAASVPDRCAAPHPHPRSRACRTSPRTATSGSPPGRKSSTLIASRSRDRAVARHRSYCPNWRGVAHCRAGCRTLPCTGSDMILNYRTYGGVELQAQ